MRPKCVHALDSLGGSGHGKLPMDLPLWVPLDGSVSLGVRGQLRCSAEAVLLLGIPVWLTGSYWVYLWPELLYVRYVWCGGHGLYR